MSPHGGHREDSEAALDLRKHQIATSLEQREQVVQVSRLQRVRHQGASPREAAEEAVKDDTVVYV